MMMIIMMMMVMMEEGSAEIRARTRTRLVGGGRERTKEVGQGKGYFLVSKVPLVVL